MSTTLFVALDDIKDKAGQTLAAMGSFATVPGDFGYKINLDYLLVRGCAAAMETVRSFGRPIFADLKMWNGGRTMASVVDDLVALGVDYLNVYALADGEIERVVKATAGSKTKVLGLTVLTHYDEAYCQKHFRRSLPKTVGHFAKVAVDAGCHGIILPGTMLGEVADLSTIKVVPGVRSPWYQDTRHSEEITPACAKAGGANILVCGSPIMKAEDKPAALRRVLEEIA